jgi:GNAT superfamily N-acetyltransferase
MTDGNPANESTGEATPAPAGVRVREAHEDDVLAVRRVLDAAMLESTVVDDAVARENAFVAVADDRVIGALVLVEHDRVSRPDSVGDVAAGGGRHVDAVAVTRRRRGQGIGRALVAAALEREGRLTAAFDPGVAPFYEALGFAEISVEGAGGGGATGAERRWAERTIDE